MYKEFIIARMRLDSNGEVTMRSHAMLLFNSVEESDTFCQSEKKIFLLWNTQFTQNNVMWCVPTDREFWTACSVYEQNRSPC